MTLLLVSLLLLLLLLLMAVLILLLVEEERRVDPTRLELKLQLLVLAFLLLLVVVVLLLVLVLVEGAPVPEPVTLLVLQRHVAGLACCCCASSTTSHVVSFATNSSFRFSIDRPSGVSTVAGGVPGPMPTYGLAPALRLVPRVGDGAIIGPPRLMFLFLLLLLLLLLPLALPHHPLLVVPGRADSGRQGPC